MSDYASDAEKQRFVEALDGAIRGNSEESLDSLFEKAALDRTTRQAVIASVYDAVGFPALMDDRDIARVALRKAVLLLLDLLVKPPGERQL